MLWSWRKVHYVSSFIAKIPLWLIEFADYLVAAGEDLS